MSGSSNIRWRESDREDLRRAVKNFNAKISRITKKNPELKYVLPEKTSVAQMKELIRTRNDLKREINALKRFSKRGAEEVVLAPGNKYNLKITKWQRTEMNRRVGYINRRRKERLAEALDKPVVYKGQELGYTKGQVGMGKAEHVSLSPMKAFYPSMQRTDLGMKFKQIMKESQASYWDWRDLLYKENYIKALKENFAIADVEEVIIQVQEMDMKEFKQIMETEHDIWGYTYFPNQSEYDKALGHIKSVWIPNKRGK